MALRVERVRTGTVWSPLPVASSRPDTPQAQWIEQLRAYQARLQVWLHDVRDPATRLLPSTRRQALALSTEAHLLAAQGLVVRAQAARPRRLAPPIGPRGVLRLPAPIAGAADDAQLARLIEQAASHQTRALAWFRRARDPATGPLPTTQRRDMLLRALEHILSAQRLLQRAQQASHPPGLEATLERHRAQLAATAANTERLLYQLDQLDTAAEG